MSDLDTMGLEQRLNTVLARLELCSHTTSGQAYDVRSGGHSEPGTRKPAGGVDWQDDKERTMALKSASSYRRRLVGVRSERLFTIILHEAEESLEAFKRQPRPTKQNEPVYGSPQWKRYIAESDEKAGDLAWRFGVDRSYVEKIRRQWSDVA